MSLIQTVDLQCATAPEQFCHSLKHTGFAVLKNHPIDWALVERVYQDWEAFFASDAKWDDTFKAEDQSGYFPFNSENAKGSEYKDLKEFYHLYLNRKHPKYPQGMGPASRRLFIESSKLASTLLRWAEAGLPRSIAELLYSPLSDMITDSSNTLMRVIHYPPLTGNEPEGSVRAAAHEDINILTLLPAATAMGLQARDKQGNWHTIEADPGQLVVNVGDMLQEATFDYYQSTTHRVVNPTGEAAKTSRFSIPLFLHARPEIWLSARYTAQDYLDERLREIGLLGEHETALAV